MDRASFLGPYRQLLQFRESLWAQQHRTHRALAMVSVCMCHSMQGYKDAL
jgi:hypothetical protein